MSESISCNDFNNKSLLVDIDKRPDTCPVCNRGIMPVIISNFLKQEAYSYSGFLTVFYHCPHLDCKQPFMALYRLIKDRRGFGVNGYLQPTGALYYEKPREFDDEIVGISPLFKKIYNQSVNAEANKLNLIAGAGYRKAVEFLMKDYLISLTPDKEVDIKKMYLGDVIKLIANKNIKICASRAVWLGNDETHYTKIHTSKDITHLKELIDLTIHWIVDEIKTSKYEVDMTDKNHS